MILFELTNSEGNQLYQDLEISNGKRQFDFLRSIVEISLATKRTFLSQTILKALNFHAIACLHTNAGEFRPCDVGVGPYKPPQHFRVQALMDDFINIVNFQWTSADPVVLAAYVLWKLNQIHPFINGNGRTARAACYFLLCVKSGGWIAGDPILPTLIRQNRHEYVAALQQADANWLSGNLDFSVLHALVARLLTQQMASVSVTPSTP